MKDWVIFQILLPSETGGRAGLEFNPDSMIMVAVHRGKRGAIIP